MTHNHKCFHKSVSFRQENQLMAVGRVAGYAPAKLQNSPRIITTTVNVESIKRGDGTHKSCQSTIMSVKVAITDVRMGSGRSRRAEHTDFR